MPTKPLIPEVMEPDETLPSDLLALRRFAHLMDAAVAIPGTRRRIGLDAAIGLVPGVGDMVGAMLSAWVIVGAIRHRVPARKIARMTGNILLDLGIGAIPLVGDVFDFLWKENLNNVDLLMRNRDRTRPPRSSLKLGLAFVLVALTLFSSMVGIGILTIWAIVRFGPGLW